MMLELNWVPDALKHAENEYPKESCGIVVNGEYLPRKNIHEYPEDAFTISGIGYASATKKGPIQAIVHSHPNGRRRPSYNDLKGWVSSGVPWCILPKGSTPVWLGMETATSIDDLVGRKFLYGVNDCYTIIQSAFKIEKGVTLPSFPSEWGWWDDNQNLYVDNFRKAGFYRLDKGEPLQPFDCLLGAVNSTIVNHAALYLGNNIILHHLVGRLSLRESSLRWNDVLSLRVRYKGG